MTYNETLPACDISVSSNNDDDEEMDSGDRRMMHMICIVTKKYVIPNLQKSHLPNQDE